MRFRKKSPYEFSPVELDNELIARGLKTPEELRFNFDDTEGTPIRDEMMENVKLFYRSQNKSDPNPELEHIGDDELVEVLLEMSEELSCNGIRGIWGDDDRKDLYRVEDEGIIKNAAFTAAVCGADAFTKETGGGLAFKTKNYGKSFHLCDNEPFNDQPIVDGRIATGFMVAPDVLATAGHVWDLVGLENFRAVFGYRMEDDGTPVTRFPSENIYRAKELLDRKYDPMDSGSDWALVRLDRAAGDDFIRFSQMEVSFNRGVYVLGYPLGLPIKFCGGAEVRGIKPAFFDSDLDIYGGNSGSPVFCRETHECLGIVVRGDMSDFRWTGSGYVSLHFQNEKPVHEIRDIGGLMTSKGKPLQITSSLGSQCTNFLEFLPALTRLS